MSAQYGTYRQRREAKAERLRGWAEKREATAAATLAGTSPVSQDWAFITQPGHIPERARMIAREDRAHESLSKARAMTGRAAGIEQQLDRAIYSDDPDAVDALRARIAGLEAERDHCKVVNAAIRAYERRTGKANTELTAADMVACGVTPADVAHMNPEWHGWRIPSYHLSGLSANIARNRKRLEALEA